MQNTPYIIRTMNLQEASMAVDWAAAEGWNPGLHDATCFYATDPNGFLIGLLGDEPIATLSVVKYGDSFGFLGFYIVKPEYRGKGYGIKLWDAGLDYLKGRTIGLDGVLAQQANYQKSGFTLAYKNIRYQGIGGGEFLADKNIVELSSVPFDETSAYDSEFFPDDRTHFLRCWLTQAQSAALGIIQNGRLAGYGVVRQCRSGYKIGPLFADTPLLAESLFLALKARTPDGAVIFLDTPEINSAAVALAQQHNMSISFETARMYAGKCPKLPLGRLFGVTTFELG